PIAPVAPATNTRIRFPPSCRPCCHYRCPGDCRLGMRPSVHWRAKLRWVIVVRMNRRTLLQTIAGGAAMTATTARGQEAQAQVTRATRGMPSPKIKDISVIATAPAGLRLTVVKITTDQDGLYGYGCGTFTQRADLVNAAVEG